MAGRKNLDDRQIKFLSFYLNPKSETYNNALQSGIRAGFSEKYSNQIVSIGNEWVNDAIRSRQIMLVKAERNLEAILDLETREPVVTMIGPLISKVTGEVVTKENANLLRTKADVSKFVAERIGKDVYGGGDTEVNTYNTIIFADGQRTKIAKRIIRRATVDSGTG